MIDFDRCLIGASKSLSINDEQGVSCSFSRDPSEYEERGCHWELWREGDDLPTYSSEEYSDNISLSQDFYDENKSWCDSWIEVNIDKDYIGEDTSFYDLFDFDRFKKSSDEWPEGYKVIYRASQAGTQLSCVDSTMRQY